MRIIAVDLDHTLLSSDNVVCRENMLALKRAYDAGVTLVVATGRMPQSVYRLLAPIEDYFSLYVCYNGALAQRPSSGDVEYEQCVSAKSIKTLFEDGDFAAYNLVVFSGDDVFARQVDDGLVRAYCRRIGVEFAQLESVEQIESLDLSIHKFFVYPNEVAENYDETVESPHEESTLEKINSKRVEGIFARKTRLGYVECTVGGVSKWDTIIRSLRLEKGSSEYEIMAIGDGYNDLEMIGGADRGVAVANAVPEAKSIADVVVSSNDDAGVAEAIGLFLQ